MKTGSAGIAFFFLALLISSAPAAELYVDLNSTNPVSPYVDWSTAATNIQDAIDASTNGDLVLVTNGIYASGGKSMDGIITNRVSLDKAITVQSINGPFVTVIQGAGITNGTTAIRCAWLTNNAVLVGFTLEWGATRAAQNNAGNGGGVWCASSNGIVANCLILSNSAYQFANGAYQGTLENCFISGNNNQSSSALYQATLENCTVVSNACQYSVFACKLTNCIVYYNGIVPNSIGTFSYCCTTPLASGPGNIMSPPQLFADGIHLTSISPCIGRGTNLTTGTDIYGQPWANPPSIGCAEWQPAPTTMSPQIQLAGAPVGFSISAGSLNGQPPFSFQWLKDGVPVQDDGHLDVSQTTNLVAIGIKFSDAGSYQLITSNAFGIVTSAVVQLVIHCVDTANSAPQAPYTNWATAATNIQDAIDAAAPGEIVLVTNGIYATGGRVVSGSSSNRIVVDKALIALSVNGYTATTIQGAWDPASTNGPAAIRCAWLTNGAVLSGFTLENGATGTGGFVGASYDSGGGVWCISTNAIVSNCELTNNSSIFGGGICGGSVNNCFLIGNMASDLGGGALNSVLNNCTAVNNFITEMFYRGAGTSGCTVRNSIVLYNVDPNSSILLQPDNDYNSSYSYSCSSPLPSGTGNINGMTTIQIFPNVFQTTATPQFLDWFHITSTSPCRGAGSTLYANGTDLDGEAWANPPSMGCDEVVISNLIGALSVNLSAFPTNALVSAPVYEPAPHFVDFYGSITGRATYITWSFGDGLTFTNLGISCGQLWTNTGDYVVTFTAYNTDNPDGVSTNVIVHVAQPDAPQLQSPVLLPNGFQFQFAGQWDADYTIQYTTNLVPPVAWQTLKQIIWNFQNCIQINDAAATNTTRFYRVLVQ